MGKVKKLVEKYYMCGKQITWDNNGIGYCDEKERDGCGTNFSIQTNLTIADIEAQDVGTEYVVLEFDVMPDGYYGIH